MLAATALDTYGLPGLFLAALLAGSVVPLPSEGVLAGLLVGGVSAPTAVGVATLGNVLGASSLYALGRWAGAGSDSAPARWLEKKRQQAGARLDRALGRMTRWGAPVLLLSSLPIVGDVFVLAAGLLGVRPAPFVVFTALGKGLRYVVVALSVLAARG